MPEPSSRHLLATLACAAFAVLALAIPSIDLGAQGAPSLLNKERADLEFPEPTRTGKIYSALGQVFDLEITFAPETREPQVPLVLENATPAEALDALTRAAGHFWVATADDAILVAEDTPQNRRAYEIQAIARWRLEHVEIKDVMTILRSLVGPKHLASDEASRTLLVRDTTERIAVLHELLDRLDQPRDEAMIEVELLALDSADFESLVAEDVRIDRRILTRQLDEGTAERLLRASAGIVGQELARVETEGRIADDRTAALEVRLGGRVIREERAVELDLRLLFSLFSLDADGDGERDVSRVQSVRSTWRVAAGDTLLVEVPGGFEDKDRTLAVALSPTLTRLGTDKPFDLFLVGTESHLELSNRAEPLEEAEKERIRERLRQRLREMPRPEASGSGESGSREER